MRRADTAAVEQVIANTINETLLSLSGVVSAALPAQGPGITIPPVSGRPIKSGAPDTATSFGFVVSCGRWHGRDRRMSPTGSPGALLDHPLERGKRDKMEAEKAGGHRLPRRHNSVEKPQ
jgi:hypothetical protein